MTIGRTTAEARLRLERYGHVCPEDLHPLPQPRRFLEALAQRRVCRRIRLWPVWVVPELAEQIDAVLRQAAESRKVAPATLPAWAGRTTVEAWRRLDRYGHVCPEDLHPLPQPRRFLHAMEERGECRRPGAWSVWIAPDLAGQIEALLTRHGPRLDQRPDRRISAHLVDARRPAPRQPHAQAGNG